MKCKAIAGHSVNEVNVCVAIFPFPQAVEAQLPQSLQLLRAPVSVTTRALGRMCGMYASRWVFILKAFMKVLNEVV